jgi:phosphopantothenoylcysteine decarboxylase/phosphopantothenate--cysteine ligase
VIRGLDVKDYEVSVVMSRAAQQLVTPHTFRSLTGRSVITGLWENSGETQVAHISLSERADILAIVPATANIIGKITAGIADDIVSTTWMACSCPKIIAPAMNDRMWKSRAVQRNIQTLKNDPDVTIIEPVKGRLANGKEAETGHLAPITDIIEAIIHTTKSS